MKGTVISIAIILFFLGCVSNSATIESDINVDTNAGCYPEDTNDVNAPHCTSGNMFPDETIPGLDSIPGLDIPPIPSGDEENLSNKPVTEEACAGVKMAVEVSMYVDAEGAELEYAGVKEYKGELWCSYFGTNTKGTVINYQKPWGSENWFVGIEDGKEGSVHIKNGMPIEACEGEVCKPFGYPKP